MRYTLDGMLPERAFTKSLFKNAPATLEGGGQSAPAPAPSSQVVTTNTIPEFFQPTAETLIGSGMGNAFNMTQNPDGTLTPTSMKPLTPFGGQVDASGNLTPIGQQQYQNQLAVGQLGVAGPSALQQQTYNAAANMQVPGQFNPATGYAAMSGAGALGTTGQAGMYGQLGAQQGLSYGQNAQNPNAVASYMNPYIQNTLTPALQLLNQQYGMAGQQEQGQATGAGAFGGSREALMNSLNSQNQMLAQNQLVGNAYNQAYNTANQNMQQAAQLGIQGAQAGLAGVGAQQAGYQGLGQAGTNLANIGTGQLAAQTGILGLQNQLGAQQQTNQQNIINQAIQNYANAQNYPMQTLTNLMNLGRSTPTQTTQTQYQAPPSTLSQLTGAGIAGLGLYNATK